MQPYRLGYSLNGNFCLNGNDVIAISAARGRLGVSKMADSESSTPLY
jgi:hypothetical protein